MNLPEFLRSSAGDGKLSARVNSFLLGLLPALVFVLPLLGVDLSLSAGQEGVELVVKLIVGLEGVLAAFWHLKGWSDRNLRKKQKIGAFAHLQ